jgi:hypothetical protein
LFQGSFVPSKAADGPGEHPLCELSLFALEYLLEEGPISRIVAAEAIRRMLLQATVGR